jgi:predicted Kef-type K+ transport protein
MQTEKSSYYNELAIAAITMGIVSFIQLFGLEKSITAIVFGILALKRIRQDETQRGKHLAIWGIVLGALYSFIAFAILPHAIDVLKKIMNAAK